MEAATRPGPSKKNFFLKRFLVSAPKKKNMQRGFLALRISLDASTTAKIPEIMEGARRLLQERLSCVTRNGFDPNVSTHTFQGARDIVCRLFSEDSPDEVVFANRAYIGAKFTNASHHVVDCAFLLVAFVRQDLCANAQCKVATAWLSNGFGFWAKVFPGLSVAVLKSAVRTYKTAGFDCHVSGASHLICPPKGGAKLNSHIDGASAVALRECIEQFLEGGSTSNKDFAQHNGVQSLVHIDGGRDGSGATCLLSPMTPARMALLLDVIALSRGAKEKAFMLDARPGPKFYTPSREVVKEYVERIRVIRASTGGSHVEQAIRSDGLPMELGWVPMAPLEDGPFALAFPRGYFHMKQANTTAGRISLAGGLEFASDAREPSIETTSKKRKLEYISAQSRMMKDPAAIESVANEKIPFSGGKTHSYPGLAAALMAPNRPFASLCFTPEEANELRALVRDPV